MKKVFIPILIPILFISCTTLKIENTSFNGMIYDGDNEPVPGAKISLDGTYQTTSDMYGRFYINGLSLEHEYLLTASKKDYETIDLTFDFHNVTEIAYLTMYSSDQLLKVAEESIAEGDIITAQNFIERADLCSGKKVSSQYLSAVILYKKSLYQDAVELLKNISIDTSGSPYVYLFTADIYEYKLKDLDKAKENLEKYLEYDYSLEIEKRYKKLCGQL